MLFLNKRCSWFGHQGQKKIKYCPAPLFISGFLGRETTSPSASFRRLDSTCDNRLHGQFCAPEIDIFVVVVVVINRSIRPSASCLLCLFRCWPHEYCLIPFAVIFRKPTPPLA
jgi:hypothetical protein